MNQIVLGELKIREVRPTGFGGMSFAYCEPADGRETIPVVLGGVFTPLDDAPEPGATYELVLQRKGA